MSLSPVPSMSCKRSSSSFWGGFSGSALGVILSIGGAALLAKACPPVPVPASTVAPEALPIKSAEAPVPAAAVVVPAVVAPVEAPSSVKL